MRSVSRGLTLFLIGGTAYFLIEVLFRGRSHWTMAVLGGLCFLFIGGINERIPWNMGIFNQALIGAAGVTAAELIFGVVLNLWLGLGIWNYSDLPLNFLGQICVGFSLLWVALSAAAIFLDDWLRYWLFKEERPHYKLF